MDRLILLRHGKAEADAASGQDFDRALTERGRTDTALVARALALAGVSPDLALVSTAARALQTWDAAQPFFAKARVDKAVGLYLIEADEILGMVQDQPGTIMVIGHNPGLGLLADRLSRDAGQGAIASFPTAAAAVIDFEGGRPVRMQQFLAKGLGGGE